MIQGVGVTVERRDWSEILPHGVAAGLAAGVALGLVQFLISAALQEGALTPFRLVASLVLGGAAFEPETSTALVMLLGGGLHLALAAVFGLVFVALLALTFQLSARAGVLVGYGFLFGFLLYEVNFLAVLPGVFPDLAPRFGLTNQLWRGIVAYALVYGPILGLYMAVARPGVRARWTNG